MKKSIVYLLIFFAGAATLSAQDTLAIYPTNWWVGMKNPKLQVMLHGNGIGNATGFTVSYTGVALTKITRAKNKNYVFLDLSISAAAKPGNMVIKIAGLQSWSSVSYSLLARRTGKGTAYAQGVTSSDFIYFLMPDRFSNGDESNDRIPGMRDQSLNRDSIFLRHGGDMQGIINHLDYLQNLGVTTLWMTPVIENDMPNRTEHGYAFTNHYKIEPRFGGETAYLKLSDELHHRGMKLIQDKSTVPIATGERLVDRKEFDDLFRLRAINIAQPDLCHVGGFSEARKIAAMADTVGVGIAPHNPLGPLAGVAALHFDIATPNFVIQEEMTGAVPWYHEVVDSPIKAEDGHWLVPERPGLGVEIDEKVAAKHPFEQETMAASQAMLSDGTVVDW